MNKDKIRQWLKDNDAYFNLDATHNRTYNGYKARLQEKMPRLYQYLVDERMIEPGRFNEFAQFLERTLYKAKSSQMWKERYAQ